MDWEGTVGDRMFEMERVDIAGGLINLVLMVRS